MKTFVLVALYLAFGLCGVAIALGGVVLATIDPYSFEDMSRGGICERSGDVAPQCSLPRESADKVRISQKPDRDSAKSRTLVSLSRGQFGGGGPRVPGCLHG
ncbi:hypothetical protein [Sinorhizobium medicae]